MRTRRLLLVLAALSLAGFAPAPFPKPGKKDDLKSLQGLWKVTVYEMGGRPVGTPGDLTVKVDRKRWDFVRQNGAGKTTVSTWELRLDPKARPRGFEWKGIKGSGMSWVGSYRLDGTRLTLVFRHSGGGPRPTDFTSRIDYRMVLERQRP